MPRERQAVGRDQQPVAQLGQAQAIVRQRLIVLKECPTRRTDLVIVTLRCGVHAELRQIIEEMVAGPVARAALDGLENRIPSGAALLPAAGVGAGRRQRRVLVVRIVRHDPGAGEADLEIGQRPVNQRPDGGIKTNPRAIFGRLWRAVRVAADVTMQAARVCADPARGGIASARWLR